MVAKQTAAVIGAGRAKTFDEFRDELSNAIRLAGGMRSIASSGKTRNTYACPIIGKVPVGSVDTALVLRVLQPIWATKNETADWVRNRIEQIIDVAITLKYRPGPNPTT